MTRVDVTDSAAVLADDLEQTYESKGFRMFWKLVQREIRIAEGEIIEIGKREPLSVEETAMSLRFQQGVLAGLQRVELMKTELLAIMKTGQIPKALTNGKAKR